MGRPVINLLNEKFNRLTVIENIGKQNNEAYWKCLCDCGNYTNVTSGNLKRNKLKSCGCLFKDSPNKIKHGKNKTPEYKTWLTIKQRCNNKNDQAYSNYGGRGISVCEKWTNNFLDFLDDMGERPGDEYSIDRIDVNGNYEPGNCRWVTMLEQNRNQRKTKLNMEKAREIRSAFIPGVTTKVEIARFYSDKFNVNFNTVRGVLNNRHWNEDF